MRKFLNLTRRNCMVFLRDRSAVFFSLLSMLIVLMLMGIFLGSMNVESVTDMLVKYGGIRDAALNLENAEHLVQYWTLAGLMVVNAVTVTLSVIGIMVDDGNENRLESFYSAPVSKGLLAVSYVAAAVIIGTVFCMLTLTVSLVYIRADGGAVLPFAALAQIVLYTLLNTGIFAVIMYLAALFIKSSSAWSGVATVVGTLVGFVGAIYLPMGALPEGVAKVLKYIPVLHGTSLMRKLCCEAALAATFEGLPGEVVSGYREYMGIDIIMGTRNVGSRFQLLFLGICGMIALTAVILTARRKNISDR